MADAARRASTDAFHLAMLVSGALLVAGAATNAVGIRNPARDARSGPVARGRERGLSPLTRSEDPIRRLGAPRRAIGSEEGVGAADATGRLLRYARRVRKLGEAEGAEVGRRHVGHVAAMSGASVVGSTSGRPASTVSDQRPSFHGQNSSSTSMTSLPSPR